MKMVDRAPCRYPEAGLSAFACSPVSERRAACAPVARLTGLIGPECAVAGDADDLTRLLAIFGRRIPG